MKILFVSQNLASFIEKDLGILQYEHQVRKKQLRGLVDIPSLIHGIIWADLTFCWFGKMHAFFAVLFSIVFHKKTVVVAGGDDVTCVPEINYGMFCFWWKKWCPLFVFQKANLILSVSEYNRKETIDNAKVDPIKVRKIYHGFDEHQWRPVNGISKETMVLTVGGINHETRIKKGLDLFIKTARHLPDIPFILVGPCGDDAIEILKADAPPNVNFIYGLYGEDLVWMYSRAKVYVQASVHESFGCSLAEAMLCECIPVVSHNAALPEIVGDCGFYSADLTSESLAKSIREALDADLDMGKRARQRIKHLFSIEKRRIDLLSAIDHVVNGHQQA